MIQFQVNVVTHYDSGLSILTKILWISIHVGNHMISIDIGKKQAIVNFLEANKIAPAHGPSAIGSLKNLYLLTISDGIFEVFALHCVRYSL